jgi:hypothetical protein
MLSIAQHGLLFFLSLFLLFHLAVLFKIIPYRLIWGGRLKSDREMYRFEIVSLFMNALLGCIVLIETRLVEIDISPKIIAFLLWLMALLFLLNTVGNAMSKNKFEKMIFTPITVLLTIFSVILALSM